MNALIKWVKDGNKEQAVTEVKRLMDSGETAEHIITQYIEPAMDSLSNKCTAENFNLLEVMLSGRAVMSIMQTLFPPGTEPAPTKGLVVIATLEGDVHDIGKKGLVITSAMRLNLPVSLFFSALQAKAFFQQAIRIY